MMDRCERSGGSLGRRARWIAVAPLVVVFLLVPARASFAFTVRMVRNINPAGSSNPTNLADGNGTLYFGADDGTHGVEPWKSNGTSTTLLRNVYSSPSAVGSDPHEFTFVHTTHGDEVFFTAQDQTRGEELWKTDGTALGTKPVKDIWPGISSGSPSDITAVPERGIVVFVAIDGTHGYELWKSDGTAPGTTMIRDIDPNNANGADPSAASRPVDIGGEVYFPAFDSTHGSELWKTDATTAGTKIVRNISPGSGNSQPQDLINLNGSLLFQANDGTHGDELWRSNGTPTGTTMVKDINPGFYDSTSSVYPMTKVGNRVFFSATDSGAAAGHGRELWKSNGTPTGTMLVRNINPGSADSSPDQLANVSGELFFSAYHPTYGTELWKSNGSAAGTMLVKDLDGTSNGTYPTHIVGVGGTAVFSACEATDGCEPWQSDGTGPGTTVLANIAPMNQSSSPDHETVSNGSVFFSATDGTNGTELWEATP